MFQSFLGGPKLISAFPKHHPPYPPTKKGWGYIYVPLKTIFPKPVLHPAVPFPMLKFKDRGIWMTQ